MMAMRRPWRLRMWAGHGARLAVVAAITWLVHAEHVAFLDRLQAVSLESVPIATIQKHRADAERIGGESAAVAGGRELLDAAGHAEVLIAHDEQVGRA